VGGGKEGVGVVSRGDLRGVGVSKSAPPALKIAICALNLSTFCALNLTS